MDKVEKKLYAALVLNTCGLVISIIAILIKVLK